MGWNWNIATDTSTTSCRWRIHYEPEHRLRCEPQARTEKLPHSLGQNSAHLRKTMICIRAHKSTQALKADEFSCGLILPTKNKNQPMVREAAYFATTAVAGTPLRLAMMAATIFCASSGFSMSV